MAIGLIESKVGREEISLMSGVVTRIIMVQSTGKNKIPRDDYRLAFIKCEKATIKAVIWHRNGHEARMYEVRARKASKLLLGSMKRSTFVHGDRVYVPDTTEKRAEIIVLDRQQSPRPSTDPEAVKLTELLTPPAQSERNDKGWWNEQS